MSAEQREIPPTPPRLATLVVYRPYVDTEGPFLSTELTALVTALHDDAVVDLCVFVPCYQTYGLPPTLDRASVPYSTAPDPGTWGYPR